MDEITNKKPHRIGIFVIILLVIAIAAAAWWASSRKSYSLPQEQLRTSYENLSGIQGIVQQILPAANAFALLRSELKEENGQFTRDEAAYMVHWDASTQWFKYEHAAQISADQKTPIDASLIPTILTPQANVIVTPKVAVEGNDILAAEVRILPFSANAQVVE